MNSRTLFLTMALAATTLMIAPLASAGDDTSRMSDAQHRKHMAGPKHPEGEQTETGERKAHPMSDVQHRKTMGGMHHPSDEQESTGEKKAHPMSDIQHRKHMGGLKHKSDEDTKQE